MDSPLLTVIQFGELPCVWFHVEQKGLNVGRHVEFRVLRPQVVNSPADSRVGRVQPDLTSLMWSEGESRMVKPCATDVRGGAGLAGLRRVVSGGDPLSKPQKRIPFSGIRSKQLSYQRPQCIWGTTEPESEDGIRRKHGRKLHVKHHAGTMPILRAGWEPRS